MNPEMQQLLRTLIAQQSGKLPPYAQPFTGLRNTAQATLPPANTPGQNLASLYGPLGIGGGGYNGPEPTPSFTSPPPAPAPQPARAPAPPPPAPPPPPMFAGPMPEMFDVQGAPPILNRYEEAERRLRPEWLTNQGSLAQQRNWWG